MRLNRTGSNWDKLERNKMNENWEIIEGVMLDVVGQITDEVVGHLIDSAKLIWKEPVDTVGVLPADAEVGETRMVREADPDGISYVYRYDGEKWEKIQAIDVTLVNEVDRRLTAKLADIEQEVSQLDDKKMNRGEPITVSQIDKNKGKLDETFMSDEFLQQMTGNTPIHAVPADFSLTRRKFSDNSVSPNVLSFSKKPKNILHFNNSMRGYSASGSTGQPVENSTSLLTDFIEIKPNTAYATSGVGRTFFYDEAKNFLTSSTSAQYTSHQNAYFARYAVLLTSIVNAQVNEGGDLLPYDSPEFSIGGHRSRVLIKPTPKSIEKGSFLEGAIEPQDIAFIRKSRNLFNKNNIVKGKAIDLVTGEIKDSASECVSDYISVKPKSTYSKSANSMKMAMYNRQGVFITGTNFGNSVESFIIPNGVEYIRISILQNQVDVFMLNEGSSLAPYDNYVFTIESSERYPIKLSENLLESVNDSMKDRKRDFYVIDPSLSEVYDAQEQSDKSSNSSVPLGTMTVNDMYALYDDLINRHPNYVRRSKLGDDSSGIPIYKYEFSPELPSITTGGYVTPTKQLKVLLVSGIHGVERLAVWTTYLMAKNLCDNWKSDAVLEALRWDVKFIIIPLANPWSFDNNQRKNYNGVDINRNFPHGWESSDDPNSETYSGVSPLSEVEAQYIYNVINENKDVVHICDFHNFFNSPSGTLKNFIYNSAASDFEATMFKQFVGKMSRKWQRKYEFLSNNNEFYGYTTWAPGGSLAYQALEYGVIGSTLEVNRHFEMEPNYSAYNSTATTMALETLVNWMTMSLRNIKQ